MKRRVVGENRSKERIRGSINQCYFVCELQQVKIGNSLGSSPAGVVLIIIISYVKYIQQVRIGKFVE